MSKYYVCDFCGNVVEKFNVFVMQHPTHLSHTSYIQTLTFDMCSTCEEIVVPASDIFISEVKKQCQKAEKESRAS